jgi:Tfp pilus assembly protein PilF
MKKTTAIILFIGLAISALLFQLPKVNVSNKAANAVEGGANRDAASNEAGPKESESSHATPLTAEQQKQIAGLKVNLQQAKTEAQQVSALEKLAAAFIGADKYDSAAYYAADYAEKHANLPHILRAGQLYFEAQTYAISAPKGQKMGEKARMYFEKALSIDPNNLLVKTNLAMTYVDTPTPMKGISLLREVIEQEPTFVPAIFNLGILAIKSNQFGKGQERFTQILKLEPNNYKAALNLGFCLAQLDKKEEAKKVLKRVLNESKDAEETKAAKELLAEMQQ